MDTIQSITHVQNGNLGLKIIYMMPARNLSFKRRRNEKLAQLKYSIQAYKAYVSVMVFYHTIKSTSFETS